MPTDVTESLRALRIRYETDPVFHAAVHIFSQLAGGYGFADDDGVRHTGPTVADLSTTAELEDAWRKIGFPSP
jgi:hypothetical protein